MARSLADKTIIITGAGTGIGAATAVACAAAGMHVVLNGRRAAPLRTVAEAVEQRGRRALVVVGDVTAAGLNQRLLDSAMESLDGFHAVFANAGYGFQKPLHELSFEALRQIFEVNFFAGFDLLQQAAVRLRQLDQPGHLLMTSSCVAKFTFPGMGAYSATKAAQHHACRALRMDLRGTGIAVSGVYPVGTKTEFFDAAGQHSEALGGAGSAPGGPAFMMQPPSRVARAVVKCLRRPKAEVWTSWPTLLATGVVAAFPRTMDWLARLR
jgi:short-subunit dehydrogenase